MSTVSGMPEKDPQMQTNVPEFKIGVVRRKGTRAATKVGDAQGKAGTMAAKIDKLPEPKEGTLEKKTITDTRQSLETSITKGERALTVSILPSANEVIEKDMSKLKSLMKDLTPKSSNEAIGVKKELDQVSEMVKTDVIGLKTLEKKQIAQGKAKRVWVDISASGTPPSKYAYFTPVPSSILGSNKEEEIRKEVETCKEIQKSLGGITDHHLAIDLEELEGEEQIEGKYTVRTSRAKNDLEKELNTPCDFDTRVRMGGDFVTGMSRLHDVAKKVQGDTKLENLLIYSNGEVKISDFGKTQSLRPDEETVLTGNPRFAPPEGMLSMKGEVYSSGLVLIRMLEQNILIPPKKQSEIEKLSLKMESGGTMKSKTQTSQSSEPRVVEFSVPIESRKTLPVAPERKGIERFLLENAKCPQAEVKTTKGKMVVYGRTARLTVASKLGGKKEINLEAQNEVHVYIHKLIEALKASEVADPDKLSRLEDLLHKMTLANPAQRPTMKEVSEEYNSIFGLT